MRRSFLLSFLAVATVAAAVLAGAARADVTIPKKVAAPSDYATPALDSGTFKDSPQGVQACYALADASDCILAYRLPTGTGGGTPLRLLAWEWDYRSDTPGPNRSIDVRIPAAALTFGTDQYGHKTVTYHAYSSTGVPYVKDPSFRNIAFSLTQSEPLTTHQEKRNSVAEAVDDYAADVGQSEYGLATRTLDPVKPAFATTTPNAAIAPAYCPDGEPASVCIEYAYTGEGWFWSGTQRASGEWNIIPGSLPSVP
jgi:hypothetical protein